MRLFKILAVLVFGWATTGWSADDSGLTDEQDRVLESARVLALQYSQSLPNFICTQITHRQTQDQ